MYDDEFCQIQETMRVWISIKLEHLSHATAFHFSTVNWRVSRHQLTTVAMHARKNTRLTAIAKGKIPQNFSTRYPTSLSYKQQLFHLSLQHFQHFTYYFFLVWKLWRRCMERKQIFFHSQNSVWIWWIPPNAKFKVHIPPHTTPLWACTKEPEFSRYPSEDKKKFFFPSLAFNGWL